MAFIVGKDQYLVFNGLNLTNSLAAEVKMNVGGQEVDVSTIGNAWQHFRQGQASLSITASGVWDSGTAATSLDTVMFANINNGGTKLTEYVPGGSASNAVLYRANGFLTSYEVGAPVNGKVGWAATIRIADTPPRTTVA